ncbi:unnamed protein product, partial [marine sediment metagenome]
KIQADLKLLGNSFVLGEEASPNRLSSYQCFYF